MAELLLPFADEIGEGWFDPPPEGHVEPADDSTDDSDTGGDDPWPIEPYPYQRASVAKILEHWDGKVPSGILVLPTGCGKTIVFGMAAVLLQRLGLKVLVLAHRDTLIQQAAAKLDWLGGQVTVEKAQQRAIRSSFIGSGYPIVVGSVQTLQGKRLQSWPRGHFDVVIVDECHHRTAKSYHKILDHLAPRYELGVTATPTRADGNNLGRIYPIERLVYELKLTKAIDDGFLVPLDIRKIKTEIDLRFVKNTAGDLNQGDLEDAIRPHVEFLARAIKAEVGGMRGVVFTPDVATADAIASGLNSLEGITAESIAGADSDDAKAGIFARYASGQTQVLVNCALLTEGWDAPWTEFVAILRPTKSLGLLTQMVGRGTRLSPATGKTRCVVLDFSYVLGKHVLVTPLDLVSEGQIPEEIRQIAEVLIEEGRQTNPQQALKEAREEHERREKARAEARRRAAEEEERVQKERMRLQVRVRDGAVRYKKSSIDLGKAADALGMEIPDDPMSRLDPPTAKQVQTLINFGMDEPSASGVSWRQAKRLLDGLFKRASLGLATLKQLNYLLALGVPDGEARRLTIGQASERIDALKTRERSA